MPANASAALPALLLVNLMWGGSLPATKIGLTEFSPFALGWLRLTLSAVLFLAMLLYRREVRRLRPGDWLSLMALGVLGYGGRIGLQTAGADGTMGASASFWARRSCSAACIWWPVRKARLGPSLARRVRTAAAGRYGRPRSAR